MADVLLTGGTGFLGSHLADALVASGHRVTCSVRRTSDTSRLDALGVRTTELDLGGEDPGRVAAAIEGTSVLVHCGGLTRARSEAHFMAVNAEGTRRLVRAAVEAGVTRTVFISSLAARGPDGAAGPTNPYGRSKAAAEAHLAVVADRMEVVVLRPGGVYGPRDSDLLPMFRVASKGLIPIPRTANPLQPVFVEDVVSATLCALEAPVPAAPLPIAHPARHAWSALADALARAVGRDARVVPVPPFLFWATGLLSEIGSRFTGQAPAMDRRRARDMSVNRWTCDISPARAALGWEPRVDVPEGLATTAAWYRAEGWL